jgi:hypothetical protein
MKCVIHRQDSYPKNVGHWRRSVALAVLLTRASARLRKEPTNTFGKGKPHPRNIRAARKTGIRDVLNDYKRLSVACGPRHIRARFTGKPIYPVMFRGAADRCWVWQESESKRMRMSANKETREARLSMVVTRLDRSSDRPKQLPMRQPSGGAPVVVRGVNDAHMAKGCRMIRDWTTEVFFNLEASG